MEKGYETLGVNHTKHPLKGKGLLLLSSRIYFFEGCVLGPSRGLLDLGKPPSINLSIHLRLLQRVPEQLEEHFRL